MTVIYDDMVIAIGDPMSDRTTLPVPDFATHVVTPDQSSSQEEIEQEIRDNEEAESEPTPVAVLKVLTEVSDASS